MPLNPPTRRRPPEPAAVKRLLRRWARRLGFADLAVTEPDVAAYVERHRAAIAAGLHGEMHFLERNQALRYEPRALLPGTRRVVCVRMDCPPAPGSLAVLADPGRAYIARYALGRDYHKLMRKRLTQLARRLEALIGPFGYRAFVDSAPVLERPLAERAGLGWIGKNTLLLNEAAGSWFLLGELFTDLPLPVDPPRTTPRCGRCTACLAACPTGAFVRPWLLDARRCISYLTIEYKGSIPLELRPLIGNRVFGCDDCQLACPWTKFSDGRPADPAFAARHGLDRAPLERLFAWSEAEYLAYTEGSPLRRVGYLCWLRNLAVALGNAPPNAARGAALRARADHPEPLVREHVRWALDRYDALEGASPSIGEGANPAARKASHNAS